MKIEVWEGLYVGTVLSCRASGDMAVVHACKDPCHKFAVGYRGHLDPGHRDYISLREGDHLYLNMVDSSKPTFLPQTFDRFREFMRSVDGRDVLIHCNRGRSRSPSLALLYLAKDLRVIPNTTYVEAARAFQELYPEYRPGRGISTYLRARWDQL